MHTLRLILAGAVILALLGWSGGAVSAQTDGDAGSPVSVTFYHTADLHENGADLTRIAEFVASRKGVDPNVLFVDSGDWFNKGDLTALETRGEAMAAMLGASGYDAMIPGNHEHTFGTERLAELIDRFGLPFVAANLVWPEGMEPEHADPYRLFELDGVTVAVIGTATPEPPGRTFPWQERDELLEFQPIEGSVRDVVTKLEERADIIVLLTHQDMNDDTKLAPALPRVDIIFGGHDHARLHDVFVARDTDTIIQRSGAYGLTFGELTVVWDGEQIVDPEWRIVVVTDELPVSDAVEEIRQEYVSQAQ